MIKDIKDGIAVMVFYGATIDVPIDEVEDDELQEEVQSLKDSAFIAKTSGEIVEIYRLIELINGVLDERRNKEACEVKL